MSSAAVNRRRWFSETRFLIEQADVHVAKADELYRDVDAEQGRDQHAQPGETVTVW